MPTYVTCALPGCTNPLIPGKSEFRLGGHDHRFCSRGCVTIAFELMRKGKKFTKAQPETVDYRKEDAKQEVTESRDSPVQETKVKVKAEEFGGAEVYRRYCDNPACKGPITVSWKGRRGEYCSNKCLKTEKENTNTMTTNDETTSSPIAAGAASTKKAAKKSAKKTAAPAKKAAKKATSKAAASDGEQSARALENAKVITLVKSDKLPEYRGVKADITKLVKDGMTVGAYKAAVASKIPGKHSWDAKNVLDAAVEAGAIKIK